MSTRASTLITVKLRRKYFLIVAEQWGNHFLELSEKNKAENVDCFYKKN